MEALLTERYSKYFVVCALAGTVNTGSEQCLQFTWQNLICNCICKTKQTKYHIAIALAGHVNQIFRGKYASTKTTVSYTK